MRRLHYTRVVKTKTLSTTLVLAVIFCIQMFCEASAQQSANVPEYVPSWVRDMTLLYADGDISRTEFVNMLHYLIDNDILGFGQVDPQMMKDYPELVRGTIVHVIDGNTVRIDDTRIRLSLIDVENSGDSQASHAVLARVLCPVGSTVYYDVDDLQLSDKYDRTIAVVYCSGASLNQLMIEFGLGWVNNYFCSKSEFREESWARADCSDYQSSKSSSSTSSSSSSSLTSESSSTKSSSYSSTNNCDPAYPDVCIPSPPPDLNCKDVPYRKFTVLQPDPHGFDGDKDGIGCES